MINKPVLVSPEKLNKHTDIFGNDIGIGMRVRSHDFAMRYKNAGKLPVGLDKEGENAFWIEGIIIDDTAFIEGCPRYTINVLKRCVSGKVESHDDIIYPPVNGTPTTIGGVTIGVVNAERI